MNDVLVAGGTGVLGREVLRLLRAEGTRVRALTRNAASLPSLAPLADEVLVADLMDSASLRDVCREVHTVFSCAGASMALGGWRDRRTFHDVDWQGNLRLLHEAKRSGVRHFVYVSVFGGDALRRTEYADAHERFVDALRESALSFAVVRPNGFHAFFSEIFRMAQRGRGLVIGEGDARTNPVHECDVAEVCRAAIAGPTGELPVGGPEVLTRRQIVELAFEVLGRAPRIHRVSPALMKAATSPLRIANRRLHALMRFGIEVALVDSIAPRVGVRTLRSHFAALAGGERTSSVSSAHPTTFGGGGESA